MVEALAQQNKDKISTKDNSAMYLWLYNICT